MMKWDCPNSEVPDVPIMSWSYHCCIGEDKTSGWIPTPCDVFIANANMEIFHCSLRLLSKRF